MLNQDSPPSEFMSNLRLSYSRIEVVGLLWCIVMSTLGYYKNYPYTLFLFLYAFCTVGAELP